MAERKGVEGGCCNAPSPPEFRENGIAMTPPWDGERHPLAGLFSNICPELISFHQGTFQRYCMGIGPEVGDTFVLSLCLSPP